jgi:short-subunit dehydrogenase involved in D-alanine esterification of teichoic acids
MALEYAKDLTWESGVSKNKKEKIKNPKLENQLYVFGKQQHRLFRLNKKVDVIVTDAPLLHSLVYDVGDNKSLKELILEEHSIYNNLNIFLSRKKKYNPNGRSQTFKQAVELDKKIKLMLDMYSGGYETIEAVPGNIPSIIKMIKKKIK